MRPGTQSAGFQPRPGSHRPGRGRLVGAGLHLRHAVQEENKNRKENQDTTNGPRRPDREMDPDRMRSARICIALWAVGRSAATRSQRVGIPAAALCQQEGLANLPSPVLFAAAAGETPALRFIASVGFRSMDTAQPG